MFHTKYDGFDDPFPDGRVFPGPLVIGCFSVDGTGTLTFDNTKMRYLKLPNAHEQVNYDLNEGYIDITKEPDEKKDNIDYVLRWLNQQREGRVEHGYESASPGQCISVNKLKDVFVCRRKFLETLISTPFEEQQGWKLSVIVHNDTIYMCQIGGETVPVPNSSVELWRKSCFWGWKLRQFITADDRGGNPVPTRPCNPLEEFDTVNKLEIQNHTLVYSSEIAAFDDEKQKYVSMKTCKKPTDVRQDKNFTRFKLQQWWAYCQLGGVSGVHVGYRDDNGIVTSLKYMSINDLLRYRRRWKDNICYHFLDGFLTWMKAVIKKSRPGTKVHLFEYFPGDKKKNYEDSIIRYSPQLNDEFNFLPSWFTEE
ncbi:decapping and exoribonuclease protein-like [Dreissena polymorpha]|uniref:Decapping nuclease n=1 Tax=Dreissena polymorpha TaxID=45954 RepID=A0A9D4QQL5_DREPO|nr:decapping and exoribonuclease protein-like [Dreissena polymorpha]KAH3839911.1 hypothetical protein DPMN_113351 [Dreissena polymorpha]